MDSEYDQGFHDGVKAEKLHLKMGITWLIFKTIPMLIAGFSIYLGYKLFVLGVSGEASIVIDAKDIEGQLINAAPGLFFAVGGLVVLIVAIVKGGKTRFSRNPGNGREFSQGYDSIA